jgi:DNA-binding Lrp family transcriptional regulator
MTNTNTKKKDDCENKILLELQKNCRTNLDVIAKRCGCSRYKVSRVMKKLKEDNTIIGYSAIVNPNKENLKHFIALIKRSNLSVDKKILKSLPVNKITDLIPGVSINLKDTLFVHGSFDWITSFTSKDTFNAKEYCNKILKMYNKYVEKVELLEIVTQVRINGYRVPQSEQIKEIL